jgi:hypothetical protein
LGIDRGLWIWRQPDYSKQYIVVADVARGDGADYSACQVFELSDMEQCAEYKGQLGTTDYGNFLIEVATKYNDAILVVENNNIEGAIKKILSDSKNNDIQETEDSIKSESSIKTESMRQLGVNIFSNCDDDLFVKSDEKIITID